jgi:hypothetical protein
MSEELKRLINLLDGTGYEVFGIDIDSNIVRVRLGIPKPVKTMTREEFDKLSIEQKSEFVAERGRIA